MKQIPSSDVGFTIKLRAASGETEPETLEDRDPCDNSPTDGIPQIYLGDLMRNHDSTCAGDSSSSEDESYASAGSAGSASTSPQVVLKQLAPAGKTTSPKHHVVVDSAASPCVCV